MRLLSLTTKNYLILAASLLVLSIPAFYFTIHSILIHKIDNELKEHKNSFFKSLRLITSEKDLKVYKHFYEEFSLNEVNYKIEKDSIYTSASYDSAEANITPFRILRSGVYLNGKHYELLIRESLLSTRELVLVIVLIKSGILTALLVGLVLVNRSLTKRVWQPFYNTLNNLKQFEIDKDELIQLPPSGIAEFQDLNIALAQLTERNHKSFLSQKEFTENASHELQTPIAIIRSKLELLMQTKELTTEQAELISNLFEVSDRIIRLNRDLLFISRLENLQHMEAEDVEMKALVKRNMKMYLNQLEEKGIILSADLSEEMIIKTNISLVETLISNLLSNAVRFTPHKGTVHILLSKTKLEISNTGEPLQHPDKIFDRFHREYTKTIGSGLGLAIVKKIAEVCKFEIQYRFYKQVHYFTVLFEK